MKSDIHDGWYIDGADRAMANGLGCRHVLQGPAREMKCLNSL